MPRVEMECEEAFPITSAELFEQMGAQVAGAAHGHKVRLRAIPGARSQLEGGYQTFSSGWPESPRLHQFCRGAPGKGGQRSMPLKKLRSHRQGLPNTPEQHGQEFNRTQVTNPGPVTLMPRERPRLRRRITYLFCFEHTTSHREAAPS